MNTTLDNLILIIGSVCAWEFTRLLGRAVADMWNTWLDARERRDIIRANEQAAMESWITWLPTSAGMAVREAELAAGAYCVRTWPVGVPKRRLAAVATKGRVAA